MASTTRQEQKLQTACDRCYRLKERCTRQSATDTCGRCDRLDLICTTNRPPRRAGRRVKQVHHVSSQLDTRERDYGGPKPALKPYSTDASPPPLDVGEWISGLSNLSQVEKEGLLLLLDQPENLNYLVVSPVFKDAARQSLTAPLPAALPVLKDAYLACAGALKLRRTDRQYEGKTEVSQANLLRAMAAMKTLRALPVSTPQDAALCLNLGVPLALFAYSAVGQGVYEISRHCISVAQPFVEDGTLDSNSESLLTFLILLEITDCLVHRRMPTIRNPLRRSVSPARDMIDRHLGLCAPLLPYYHDLCVINHSLANTTDASYLALAERQLSLIQADVEAWQPSPPDDFMEQYKSAEVIHLLAQAKLYRLAAILLSHRLRYKFGEKDDQAGIWAQEIMNELMLVRRATKRSAQFVTLPFVVAAIEMRDLPARSQALENVDEFVDQFTPAVQKVAKTFLARVWWQRDKRLTASWFESTHKPCVLLSSVDTALFGCATS